MADIQNADYLLIGKQSDGKSYKQPYTEVVRQLEFDLSFESVIVSDTIPATDSKGNVLSDSSEGLLWYDSSDPSSSGRDSSERLQIWVDTGGGYAWVDTSPQFLLEDDRFVRTGGDTMSGGITMRPNPAKWEPGADHVGLDVNISNFQNRVVGADTISPTGIRISHNDSLASINAIETTLPIKVGIVRSGSIVAGGELNVTGDSELAGNLSAGRNFSAGYDLDITNDSSATEDRTVFAAAAKYGFGYADGYINRNLAKGGADDRRIPSWKHVYEYADSLLAGGIDISDLIYSYEWNPIDPQPVSSPEDGVRIPYSLEEKLGGVNNGYEDYGHTLYAGENVRLEPVEDSPGYWDRGVRITSEKTQVAVEQFAPDFNEKTPAGGDKYVEGDMWFNSTDGRLYIAYENTDPNTGTVELVWIDASPAALNGGDFLMKAGDVVQGDFFVGEMDIPSGASDSMPGYTIDFFAQNYRIENLPDITAIP